MKKKLITTTTANPTTLVTSLPQAKRGRPLMLGELDTRVQTAIRRIRADGGTVNRHITLATAIIKQCKPSLLKDHGGHLNLTRHWCKSFMKWMGLTKRKATKAARALPENFNQEKQLYLSTIAQHIQDHQVPDSMVINFDQTEVNIIPSSERSYSGPWDVPWMELCCHHKGKTEMCHPNFDFPDSWDIHHSPNHWSNSATMERYAEKILLHTIEQLQLPSAQWRLAIFDMFKAHQPLSTALLHKAPP